MPRLHAPVRVYCPADAPKKDVATIGYAVGRVLDGLGLDYGDITHEGGFVVASVPSEQDLYADDDVAETIFNDVVADLARFREARAAAMLPNAGPVLVLFDEYDFGDDDVSPDEMLASVHRVIEREQELDESWRKFVEVNGLD
jgi:hypothetical protein